MQHKPRAAFSRQRASAWCSPGTRRRSLHDLWGSPRRSSALPIWSRRSCKSSPVTPFWAVSLQHNKRSLVTGKSRKPHTCSCNGAERHRRGSASNLRRSPCLHTRTLGPAAVQPIRSSGLLYNGLHPRNSCNYIDYYSLTDPRGMQGWVKIVIRRWGRSASPLRFVIIACCPTHHRRSSFFRSPLNSRDCGTLCDCRTWRRHRQLWKTSADASLQSFLSPISCSARPVPSDTKLDLGTSFRA